MSHFGVLFTGELQRMVKYSIIGASILVSGLWILVLHFTEVQDVGAILPLLLFVDAVSMSIILIGVTIFFEKQEGTLKTLLVSPITKMEYVLAKTSANIVSNVLTLLIVYSYAWLFREVNLSLAALFGAVVVIAVFHSLVGFWFSYYSSEFTDLLMNMFKYLLVFSLPVFLEAAGLITNELVLNLMHVLPTKASMTLLHASGGEAAFGEVLFSAVYLVGGSAILLHVVLNKFDEFAVKESGV